MGAWAWAKPGRTADRLFPWLGSEVDQADKVPGRRLEEAEMGERRKKAQKQKKQKKAII